MPRLARILVPLLLLAVASAAQAQSRPSAILDLNSLGRTLSAAVGEQARTLGNAVLDSRDVARRIGQAKADAAVACGLDATCLAAAISGPKGEQRLGTLVVTSAVSGAEIRVDGEVVGTTPEVRVPPIHEKEAQTPPAAKKQPLGLHLPVGTWAGLGTAMALTGAGAWYGLQAQRVAREAVDLDHDGVLDLTRAEALAGRDWATTANILYGLAGVAAVTAGVFAMLPSRPARAPTAVALVSPAGAFVSLGGRF